MLNLIAHGLEEAMYSFGQLFLIPVLVLIFLQFFYAFYVLGAFALQALRRKRGDLSAFELQAKHQQQPETHVEDLEAYAVIKLEWVRIVSRVAPMLGLVATMIPLGPALKALGDGQLGDVSRSLMVAFSAVILSLLTASIAYFVSTIKRRWYTQELQKIEQAIAQQKV